MAEKNSKTVIQCFDNPFFNMNGNSTGDDKKNKENTTTTTTTTAIISTNTSIDSSILVNSNGADLINDINKETTTTNTTTTTTNANNTSPLNNIKYPAIESDDQLINQKGKLKSPFDNSKFLEQMIALQSNQQPQHIQQQPQQHQINKDYNSDGGDFDYYEYNFQNFNTVLINQFYPSNNATTTTTTTTTTPALPLNNENEQEDILDHLQVDDDYEVGFSEYVGKLENITATFSFVSDIIDSLTNAFEDGDIWRNDTENEQFLKTNYSEFLQCKSQLKFIIKTLGNNNSLDNLLNESIGIDNRFESLKKQLEYYKIKNEQFNSERLSKLQKEYGSNSGGASGSGKSSSNSNNNNSSGSGSNNKTKNTKFKKVYNIFKSKFDGISNGGGGGGNENVNSNNMAEQQQRSQQQEEQDEIDEELKYQQNFEIKNVEINQDGKDSITCPICYSDDVEQDQLFLISQCGHVYCIECLSQYLSVNILSRKIHIACPSPKCTSWFQYGQIKYLVDETTFTKYEEFTFSTFLMKSENYKWCPNKNCENAVYGEIDNPRTRCSSKSCNFDFCFNCEVEWHQNSTCEQYKIWEIENKQNTTLYDRWTKTTDLKKCPKCSSSIERISGCHHITCAQCQYQFCWLCSSKYSNNHFNSLNPFGCPGLATKKISNPRRIAYKSALGVGVLFGGIVVIGIGVPTVLVGLIPYCSFKIYKHAKNKHKNKNNNINLINSSNNNINNNDNNSNNNATNSSSSF